MNSIKDNHVVKIAGAGPSGLAAAITPAKAAITPFAFTFLRFKHKSIRF